MSRTISDPEAPSLLALPDELLEAIIQHLNPVDTVILGRTCKHAGKVTNSPLTWRRHCVETWKGWHPKHKLAEKLSLPPTQTQWRQLYNERTRTDSELLATFDDMLSTQRYRYSRMEKIAVHGQDATDRLIKLERETPDSAEDVLARRYHAKAILGQIHRAAALDTWMRLSQGDPVKLEEALEAYDLFVFAGSYQEVGNLSSKLDDIAQGIRSSHADVDLLPVRQKAIIIAETLRSANLLGMSDESDYHALQNNFLSTAFTDHSSLPLQSVAIYCAVAQRLDVDAQPSNYPQHVYAVIRSSDTQTLDGENQSQTDPSSAEQEYMYLDPWRSSEEVSGDELRLRLSQMGILQSEHMNYLGPASVLEITLRTGRNMMVSVEEARHRVVDNPIYPDLEAAWYSMLWAMVILGDAENRAAYTRRRQFIPYLVQRFQSHSPEDIHLMDLVPPLFERERERQVLVDMLEACREMDADERTVKSREAMNSGVQHRIGHYFKHKRYGYEGFIIGWDAHCAAGTRWISQMGVDELPKGRQQPFYNIIADDKSVRYVAEENIEVLQRQPPSVLMNMAGRYFKRWNDETNKFESNIVDDYPDD